MIGLIPFEVLLLLDDETLLSMMISTGNILLPAAMLSEGVSGIMEAGLVAPAS